MSKTIISAATGVVVLPNYFAFLPRTNSRFANEFSKRYAPKYIIANSAAMRLIVPAFEAVNIPVIFLIHEFSSNIRLLFDLHPSILSASEIVFPAHIVADSILADYHILHGRSYRIIAQGMSKLPLNSSVYKATYKFVAASKYVSDKSVILDDQDSLIVAGFGSIYIRKGVDFFIATIAKVLQLKPKKKVKFCWIGKANLSEQPYLDYLQEQVKRFGIVGSFFFLGEFEDLEPIYRRADICFVSSRLDPLPNIAIDSSFYGLPVICFDNATGMADILKSNIDTKDLVVPYLDTEAAAQVIVAMANDPAKLKQYSHAMQANLC